MSPTNTSNQAAARLALSNILSCLRRRSAERHGHISKLIGAPSFFWLADQAGLDPQLTRRAFRQELERVRAAGFGLAGKGRIGGGRKS